MVIATDSPRFREVACPPKAGSSLPAEGGFELVRRRRVPPGVFYILNLNPTLHPDPFDRRPNGKGKAYVTRRTVAHVLVDYAIKTM